MRSQLDRVMPGINRRDQSVPHCGVVLLSVLLVVLLAASPTGSASQSRLIAAAERVTLKFRLSRAGVTSLHRKHNRLKVTLKASFTPTKGQGSSASVTVSFA